MNRKYGVLVILSLLSVITFLDRNAISLAGQRITQELGLSENQFGWILSAFTISYALFEIPTGMLGDRVGAKKTLARVVLWWSFFTMFTGLAGGFASLIFVRFFFGAGEAGAFPNAAIAVRRWFPVMERGRAQAVIWMSSRIGGALTPFLVIPLQMQFGWRLSFYILGALGLVWVIVWWFWYRDNDAAEEPVNQQAGPVRPSWKRWSGSRNFWLLMIMYYCYVSGAYFFILWLPKYLQNGRGIPEAQLTYSASLPFFLAAIGCLLGGSLSDFLVKRIGLNWGRRLVPLVGLSLSGTFMLVAAFTPSNAIAIVLLALGLAFMDVTVPVSWAVATDLGGTYSGAITGAMNTAGQLGATVTSLGIGYLITSFHSYNLPVVILGIELLVGAMLWFFIKADQKII